jgi:hypothetical protein
VRGAYRAGKLSVGFWDHWVPGANGATEKADQEWAEKEKVDVTIDFITSQGNKLLLTTAAEAQAKSGHDISRMNTFLPARYSSSSCPMNRRMDQLIKQNGKVNATVEYLGKIGGKWLAVPATIGSQIQGSVLAHRLMKKLPASTCRRCIRRAPSPRTRTGPRHLPQGAESLPEGRQSVRHRPRHDVGQRRHDRRDLPRFGAVLVNAKGDIVRQDDRSARRSTTTRS